MLRILTLVLFSLRLAASGQSAEGPKDAPAKKAAGQQEKKLPVPQTLEEAHRLLEEIFPPEELAEIEAMKTEDEMLRYHRGLGMYMRNEWGLWRSGPLAKQMKALGFHHPDIMSSIILETFWCKRHKKDFGLKERAAYYEAYAKATAEPPETAKDPKDGSEVRWTLLFGDGDDKNPRLIHVGKSKKTGRWLAFERDKGVYEPDATLLKRIQDRESSDPFGPAEESANK